jgi:hypothetical protein
MIYEDKDRYNPGYHGLIFVDRDSGMVSRITLEAENLPTGFPITAGSDMLDYDLAKVGDQEFVLPLRAEVRLRQGRVLTKNEVEFRLYRKFSADASITFETPEPLPADKTTEQPPKP